MKTTPLFVVGAKGLLAAETLRLALTHSGLGPCYAYSRTAMKDLREVHPQLPCLQPVHDLQELCDHLECALADGPAALVFATPHGVAKTLWRKFSQELVQKGAELGNLRVVDLSEDHRLGTSTDGEANWFYGLPELHPIPSSARRVAVAGCFATAMQLAVMPLHRAKLLKNDSPFILHGVTASSGSGATAKQGTHHPFRQSNFHPYALNGHRHEKELCHSRNFEESQKIVFLPYSGPLGRGIYLTATLPLGSDVDGNDLIQAFHHAYADKPFVELKGVEAPQLRAVIGSNRAAIGWNQRNGLAQVFVALDNTIKGGAGQGLQCLNLMLNLPETTGLPLAGLGY